MKYSKFLLLLIASASWYSFSQELPLQKLRVSKKAIEIEKMMKRDKCITYSFTALSIVQAMYPLISLSLQQKELKAKEIKTESKESDQKFSMWQSVCQSIVYLAKTPVYLIKDTFTHLFFTQEGWTSMALASVSFAGNHVIARVCNKFIHPDTLYWYIHSHAPYQLTISIMKKQQQSDDSKEFLCLLHQRLVRQAEAICAYQVYKYKRLDVEEKEIAQRAARTIFMLQQYWLHSIAQQLKAETINYQELYTMLSDYEEAIRVQINHFSIIEGETAQDRYVVKRQVKQYT